jgi:hypothetical protein
MRTGANRQSDKRHVPRHRMRCMFGRVRVRRRIRAKGDWGGRVSFQNVNASGLVPLRL